MLLVLFAVLISGLRLMLPYVENYRTDVENYINESYQSKVSIGSLSMGWHKVGPVLIANNVNLIDEEAVRFTIDSIDVRVDFWRSLLSQKVITEKFILTGASLILDKQALLNKQATQQTPQSIKDSQSANNDAPVLEGLADLFYEQIARFSLIDSKVVVNNGQRQRTFLISQLNWLNIDKRRVANADVIVDGLTSNNIKLQLDVTGNHSQDISGTLYIKGNNLNITPWLDKVLAIENEKTDSSINLSAWLTIKNGLAQQLQVAFDNSEISWQHQNVRHSFALNKGQMLLENLNDLTQLSVTSSALEFSANDQDWQPLSIQVNRDNDNLFAYLSYVDLFSTTRLFPLFFADNDMRNMIDKLSLQGSIHQFYLQKNADQYQISADFEQFSSEFYQGIPGIKNSQGSVLFSDNQLQVDLSAKQGALDFAHHFILPIPYQQFDADLNISFDEQGWKLTSKQLSLISNEIEFSADLGINVPNDGLASMSLFASMTNGHVELAHHYFPLASMSDSLVGYLKQGLVSGDIDQALVIYHGAFANFPFDDQSGIFTVDAELSESIFNFDDDWANITKFNANLNFTNNSMMITARSGELSGLDITGVKVGIAELSNDPILTVDIALIDVKPANVTQLMLDSSLSDSVGKILQQLVISNNFDGHFNLNLPLDRPEDVIAKGTINFSDNLLSLQSPQISFSQLNGQLSFINDVIKADDLELVWQQLPLSISIDAGDKTRHFNTNIHINADWQQETWLEHVPSKLKAYADGHLKWQGDLVLNSHHDGNFSYNFIGHSTLKGLALVLPEPYFKTSQESTDFTVKVVGNPTSSTLDVNLGEQLSFYGLLNHQEPQVEEAVTIAQNNVEPVEKIDVIDQARQLTNETQVYFSRAHLVLGNEKMLLPTDGFHITTALAEADFETWQPFVSDILDSIDANELPNIAQQERTAQQGRQNSNINELQSRPLIATPERIRGSIDKLNVLGQTLTNVSFNVLDQEQWWLLQLNAKEARTEIKFYPSWETEGIDVKADFLHLSANIQEDSALKALIPVDEQVTLANENIAKDTFINIPPMRFTCDSCRIDNLDFGLLNFEVQRPEPTKIALTHFSARRGKSKLSLNGQWLFDDSSNEQMISNTSLTGQLTVDDIEFEMEKLGFASSIKESGGVLDFTLDWQGGPQDFLLSELNGEVTAKLDDGVLADVDDKGLRVASILSLGSLARKLKLDFRDIFSEGLFYSNITGDFTIKNGVIYTENSKLKGAAGDLTIKGNTDLAAGLLDYRMNYKPNLTSSLPTIAWIATLNPVVFLTGLAINEIITATVIYEVVFEVTGDIDQPIVREVDRKNQDVSVGSSTPPEHINDDKKTNEIPIERPNKFKEIKTSSHSQVDQKNNGEING